MRGATAVLTLLVFSSAGHAQEGGQPIVRARIETATPVMVGETVTLSVDVLTPTWFPRAPGFPAALDVENAVAVFDDRGRQVAATDTRAVAVVTELAWQVRIPSRYSSHAGIF